MPAAQVKGTSETLFCFLAMSGPNRWRPQESTARASNDPPPDFNQSYQSEDSEHESVEYPARKSREFPVDTMVRTREFRAQENHHEYCFRFRQECQWYQDKEMVRLSVMRGRPPILGPYDMSMFVKKQTLMDAVSWSLFWEKRHEFDPFTRWQADFIRYMFGWLTQEEEDDFQTTCTAISQDMSGKSKHQSKYFHTSKALTKFLRHDSLVYLFDSNEQ